jgi:hypothetical protein
MPLLLFTTRVAWVSDGGHVTPPRVGLVSCMQVELSSLANAGPWFGLSTMSRHVNASPQAVTPGQSVWRMLTEAATADSGTARAIHFHGGEVPFNLAMS